MSRLRLAALLAATFALAFWAVLRLFPSKSSCVASGRTVDPTERHCVGPNGYVQLREHVLFHTREPLVAAAVIGGVFYWVRRRRRARQQGAPPNAGPLA